MLVLDWRSGKLHAPRDPPFQRPHMSSHDEEEGDDDEDASYAHIPPMRRDSAPNDAQSPFADPLPQRYAGPPVTASAYTPALQQPLTGRPSMDAYGAFSDPAPTGFGSAAGGGYAQSSTGYSSYTTSSPSRPPTSPPTLPEPDMGGPMVSRTMQYADPYAAVRASIAGGPASPTTQPPGYDYSGYR